MEIMASPFEISCYASICLINFEYHGQNIFSTSLEGRPAWLEPLKNDVYRA